jgi:hypothetical protein
MKAGAVLSRVMRGSFFLIAFSSCNHSNEAKSNGEDRNSDTSDSYPAAIKIKFDFVQNGMSKAEVDKIFLNEPIEILGDSVVSYGRPPKLWHNQSPVGGGRIHIKFDNEMLVIDKNLFEDYYGVPWREELIDSGDFFSDG